MKYFLLYFIFQSEFRVSTVLFYNVILELYTCYMYYVRVVFII